MNKAKCFIPIQNSYKAPNLFICVIASYSQPSTRDLQFIYMRHLHVVRGR